jgi:hypothetical protein
VIAYCAPGLKVLTEIVVFIHGEDVDEVVEHPWFEDAGFILLVDPPTDEGSSVQWTPPPRPPVAQYPLLAMQISPTPLVLVTGVA